jgi:hypothetical protein
VGARRKAEPVPARTPVPELIRVGFTPMTSRGRVLPRRRLDRGFTHPFRPLDTFR